MKGAFSIFKHPFCCKISKKLKLNIFEKNSHTAEKAGGGSPMVPKKLERVVFCFGMVLYFMLEAGCVQNEVLSNYGKSAQCTKSGPIALN